MTSRLSRADFLKLSAATAVGLAAGVAHAADATPILRAIPKSGEKLPVIGLGTNQIANGTTPEGRQDLIRALLDGGSTLIDTAPMYGQSEEVIGNALAELNARKRAFLATKVLKTGRDEGIASLQESFKRLRTDVIDLMQVHNLQDTATQLAIMREWKKDGRIRYIGITHSEPEGQEALYDVLMKEPVDFVQMNYSLDVRGPEKRLLKVAADKGVGVLVNLPLGRGKILKKLEGKPLPAWSDAVGVTTWAQLLLKFVISNPAITAAIPATRNAKHVAENQVAGRGALLDSRQRAELIQLWEKA